MFKKSEHRVTREFAVSKPKINCVAPVLAETTCKSRNNYVIPGLVKMTNE